MQLSEKPKTFPNLYLHFLNLIQIWNIFKKKMTLIADVFPKFFTPKNMVISMPKKYRLGGCVKKQHGNCTQTFLNMKDSSFTIFIDHCKGNCLTKRLCYKYAKSQNCFLRH